MCVVNIQFVYVTRFLFAYETWISTTINIGGAGGPGGTGGSRGGQEREEVQQASWGQVEEGGSSRRWQACWHCRGIKGIWRYGDKGIRG